MSNYYTGVMILTVFGMIVMTFIVDENPTLAKNIKKRFFFSYIVVMAGAVLEWLAVFLQVHSSAVFLHLLVKTLELDIAPIIPVAILPAISEDRRLLRVMASIAVANAIIEFLSAKLGFVFYVDAANVYHHGKFYFLYISSYMIEIVCLIVGAVSIIRKHQSRGVWLLFLMFSYLVMGIAMQVIDSSIRVDYITIMVVLIFLYIEHEDVIRSSDSLTKILNRHCYDSIISNIKSGALIVNIDIDYFKRCNDTYGHLFGDQVLKEIADVIHTCVGRNGMCFRTGGDEFCILIEGRNSVDPERLIESLHQKMAERRKKDERLPFISTGYAVFVPVNESFQDAVERADIMMYKFKNFRKKLLSEGKDASYAEIQRILKSTSIDGSRTN